MRPRETIAMALIGWNLLIAPRKYQSLCPYFDVDAPLHEWTSKGGFTAKVDCEGARRLFLDPVFRECWSLRYPPEHARANNNLWWETNLEAAHRCVPDRSPNRKTSRRGKP